MVYFIFLNSLKEFILMVYFILLKNDTVENIY